MSARPQADYSVWAWQQVRELTDANKAWVEARARLSKAVANAHEQGVSYREIARLMESTTEKVIRIERGMQVRQ